MNGSTLIAVLIVAAVVFLAVRYIIIQKKKGVRCIGCPNAGTCCKSSNCHNCNGGCGGKS